MIEELPLYIDILFALTVLGTIAWFYAATRSGTFLITAIGWTILSLAFSEDIIGSTQCCRTVFPIQSAADRSGSHCIVCTPGSDQTIDKKKRQ